MYIYRWNDSFHVSQWTHESRGWNWARRTGEGNRSRRPTSPDATSHNMTFQSVEELSSWCPLRFQLVGEGECRLEHVSLKTIPWLEELQILKNVYITMQSTMIWGIKF